MYLYSSFNLYKLENLYNNLNSEIFIVKIISNKEEKQYVNKYYCKVLLINKENKYKNSKLLLYTDKESEYKYGDIIKIEGNFEYATESRNYKGYNYRRVLWQEKIYGILEANKIIKLSHKNNLESLLNSIKIKLENNIESTIEYDEYKEFLKGILLGDKSNISKDVKQSFKDASLSHILAISGMHLGYIIILLKYALCFINNKKLKNIFSLIILTGFVILIGKTPSSIRALIMYSMVVISRLVYRKSNSIINFFLALDIVLILNPLNIENIGIWLSFGGTFGILVIYSKLNIKNKFLNYILQNFLISISVQIIIYPIILYNFNTISFTFFISNIFISFFIAPIMFLGFLICIIGKKLFIGELVYFIEKILLNLVFYFTNFISNLEISKIYAPTPLIFNIIFYYIILFIIIYKEKFFQFIKKLIVIIILTNIIYSSFTNFSNDFSIFFIDVGQGDCTLIKTKNNKTILIDGGEGNSDKVDQGEYTLLPYLLDRRIKKIDYLMVSHFDSDHVGRSFVYNEKFRSKKCNNINTTRKFKKF